MRVLYSIWLLIRALFRNRAELVVENLALRQQLAILKQHSKRPRLGKRDRIFWAWLSRFWPNWRSVLVIVRPETVVRWHQQGFKLYWRWKSRSRKPGRPKIDAEIRKLIRRMSLENPTWGTPRIRSELRLLGYEASKATVDKYKVRHHKPPSQTWRAFLDNHVPDIVAVDFFTVPTATFRILFCFILLRHHRRRVTHSRVSLSSWGSVNSSMTNVGKGIRNHTSATELAMTRNRFIRSLRSRVRFYCVTGLFSTVNFGQTEQRHMHPHLARFGNPVASPKSLNHQALLRRRNSLAYLALRVDFARWFKS